MNTSTTHHYVPTKSMPYVLAFLAFALPLSSSGLGVAIGLMIATFSVGFKEYKPYILKVLSQPVTISAFFFLLWIGLACLWSPAPEVEQLIAIKKYAKLLCLPLFIVAFANSVSREWALRAFLSAMVLCTILVFVQWIGRFNFGHYTAVGSLFRNYIMLGHMTALASYLTAWRAIDALQQVVSSRNLFTNSAAFWIYATLFVLFSVEILFLSEGRTGYVLYFGLLMLLMLQRFNLKQCLLGAALLIFFAVSAFYISQSFRVGVEALVDEVQQYQAGIEDSSIGDRFQFQVFSKKLFLEKPWIGHGTASLAYFFEVENPVPNWDQAKLREPHNQYWLVAAELGVVGLILFGLFLSYLAYAILSLPTMKPLAFAVLASFLVGNMTDSLLYYSGTGYLFLMMMGLCLGETVSHIASAKLSKTSF